MENYLKFLFRKLAKPAIPIFAGTLLAFSFLQILPSLPDGYLHFKVYNVGQGDTVLIRTAKGKSILIDGGPDNRISSQLSSDLGLFNRSLEAIILTHPHADHVAGLIDVLKKFKVKSIIYNSDHETRVFRAFEEAVEQEKLEGAKVYSVQTGDKIKLGDLNLDFLWPEDRNASNSANLNNLSIVSLLKYKNFEAFLPGDQEVNEAERMMKKIDLPVIEVLKVAHHGSRNGLNYDLLEKLRPQLAIISAGKGNKYGHPHPSTLQLLKDSAVKIRRTDEDGSIEVISDGEKFWLRN